MFINLSRRSVPLIDRLARMIDSLEQNEDDPDRLSSLFSMDHLVTRMRRNSENLLVLAGEEPVRKWSKPVPLTDVASAASAEIEQYTRVVLDVAPDLAVSGQVASDVVHLLAEIVENATISLRGIPRCACLAASSAAAACCSRSRTTALGFLRPGSRR